ncbi:hypothetical protein tloyanaT_10790 [Thalassotalea loyana]|uniref:Uncharacterized protein n=2 Tax=Thalassotalea loyana TaxID=280483 RepID=A0ABQ6HDK8_9GAMM|nr:hypothetical protein tloyanaT_10790 [Thalassotalea loyana]
MKLIMRSEFDDLRENPNHQYDVDKNGDKQVVKIYCNDLLIAKKVTHKKSIRYFGIKQYKDFLTS